MAAIKCFEELDIWQMAREFCKDIFRIINYESFSKDFQLKGQIRDSSGSVMDNIAEGFERSGNKEFVQFLFIAKGSCGESRSQLYRALDSGYICTDEFNQLKEKAEHLSQSISKLISYLKNSEMKGYTYK